jgi:hypothetical protein
MTGQEERRARPRLGGGHAPIAPAASSDAWVEAARAEWGDHPSGPRPSPAGLVAHGRDPRSDVRRGQSNISAARRARRCARSATGLARSGARGPSSVQPRSSATVDPKRSRRMGTSRARLLQSGWSETEVSFERRGSTPSIARRTPAPVRCEGRNTPGPVEGTSTSHGVALLGNARRRRSRHAQGWRLQAFGAEPDGGDR